MSGNRTQTSIPNPSAYPFGSLNSAGLVLDLAYQGITSAQWQKLFKEAHAVGLPEHIAGMFSGKPINTGEQRAALHTALRNLSGEPVCIEHEDVMPAVADVWRRMESLCNKWVGITDVIHIGIGGSDFGPRLAVEALSHVANINSRGMRMHFAANVDTAELSRILERAQPNSTRIIIVSKSFTTLETMMNARAVVNWLKSKNCTQSQIQNALIAVTANVPAAEVFGIQAENIYPFWDWVGGRFSVWSAVGLPIALQYGFTTFKQFLEGAEAMDLHFLSAPLEKNLPVLMALALFHQQQKHHAKAYAVIPYAHALELFPFWLQQLDMESHGKSIGRDGKPISFSSPVVFGSAGSNAQHSYFQLFHQGKDIVPVDFIAVREPMSRMPEAAAHHRTLLANCLAQAQALAHGKSTDKPEQQHTGNRPSNLVLLPKLDAFHLGALLALYESRAVSLGVLWNINSFDQPGVELGKVLAKPIEKALAANTESDDVDTDAITAARITHLRG